MRRVQFIETPRTNHGSRPLFEMNVTDALQLGLSLLKRLTRLSPYFSACLTLHGGQSIVDHVFEGAEDRG